MNIFEEIAMVHGLNPNDCYKAFINGRPAVIERRDFELYMKGSDAYY